MTAVAIAVRCEMAELNERGDTKFLWDPDNPSEVEAEEKAAYHDAVVAA